MLDIRDYDLAVVDRIKTFYDNTHFVMRPNLPLQEIRNKKILDGKDVEFPIIVVRRTNCPIFSKEYNSWSRAKSGQTYLTADSGIGHKILQNYDPELAIQIINTGHNDAVSVVNSTFDLTYYIDVISLERDNFDTLLVELQENLFTIPYIGFYNFKSDGSRDKLVKSQACHLLIEEIEDTSDLENFDSGNALYRATITAKINAYIYRKYKSKSLEKCNISSKVVPKYIGELGFESLEDYILSDMFLNKLNESGYSNLEAYYKSLGFSSLEEFIDAINSGKLLTIYSKFGPDSFVLRFEIPPSDSQESNP
jgi:hypothetical protein